MSTEYRLLGARTDSEHGITIDLAVGKSTRLVPLRLPDHEALGLAIELLQTVRAKQARQQGAGTQ